MLVMQGMKSVYSVAMSDILDQSTLSASGSYQGLMKTINRKSLLTLIRAL